MGTSSDSRTVTHTLSVLVEDKPGVLARVAALFSRRGFNIESLAVGATEHKNMSRMTIVVTAEETPLEQITKQLNKLINVIKIVEQDDDDVGGINRWLDRLRVGKSGFFSRFSGLAVKWLDWQRKHGAGFVFVKGHRLCGVCM